MIQLRSSGQTQRIPLIFVKTSLLRVHTDQVASMIYVHDRVSLWNARAVVPTGTTADMLAPRRHLRRAGAVPRRTGRVRAARRRRRRRPARGDAQRDRGRAHREPHRDGTSSVARSRPRSARSRSSTTARRLGMVTLSSEAAGAVRRQAEHDQRQLRPRSRRCSPSPARSRTSSPRRSPASPRASR